MADTLQDSVDSEDKGFIDDTRSYITQIQTTSGGTRAAIR